MANLLIAAYRTPATAVNYSLAEWDRWIRQARKANLLASFHALFDDHNLLQSIPPQPKIHLEAARRFADKHATDIRWEISKLSQALAELNQPLILLKGAAYLARGLANSRGRLFQDTDILVPQARLTAIEKQLNKHGWYQATISDYDEHYYRTWSHELPPMRHLQRKSLLDVHHRIVQRTTRQLDSTAKLLQSAQPVADNNIHTLSPVDMVLHSVVHLFNDGEFDHALRDLIDIDQLIRLAGTTSQQLEQLTSRANELDLSRPLFYALRYLRILFNADYCQTLPETKLDLQPNRLLVAVMDKLFVRAIAGHHPSCGYQAAAAARWCLYVRAHYLRMPLYLLIPHLAYKGFQKEA